MVNIISVSEISISSSQEFECLCLRISCEGGCRPLKGPPTYEGVIGAGGFASECLI